MIKIIEINNLIIKINEVLTNGWSNGNWNSVSFRRFFRKMVFFIKPKLIQKNSPGFELITGKELQEIRDKSIIAITNFYIQDTIQSQE